MGCGSSSVPIESDNVSSAVAMPRSHPSTPQAFDIAPRRVVTLLRLPPAQQPVDCDCLHDAPIPKSPDEPAPISSPRENAVATPLVLGGPSRSVSVVFASCDAFDEPGGSVRAQHGFAASCNQSLATSALSRSSLYYPMDPPRVAEDDNHSVISTAESQTAAASRFSLATFIDASR